MKRLFAIVIIATAAPLAGCLATTTGEVQGEVVVEEEPPPPRQEVIEVRPGYVHVEGHWYRRGNKWEWQEGRYEAERHGEHWVAGHWDRRGDRKHVWVEGHWSR